MTHLGAYLSYSHHSVQSPPPCMGFSHSGALSTPPCPNHSKVRQLDTAPMPKSQLELLKEANLTLPGLPSCEDHNTGFCSRFPEPPSAQPWCVSEWPLLAWSALPTEIYEYKSSLSPAALSQPVGLALLNTKPCIFNHFLMALIETATEERAM